MQALLLEEQGAVVSQVDHSARVVAVDSTAVPPEHLWAEVANPGALVAITAATAAVEALHKI